MENITSAKTYAFALAGALIMLQGNAVLGAVKVTVTISVNPASTSLKASQQQQFTSSVAGSSNAVVTWSLTPASAGTVTSAGLYSAPAQITAAQTLTVKATSLADPTKSATAVVKLVPIVVTVSVSPDSISLNASQQQQFTSSITGSSNTAVTWSLAPPSVGTLTPAGLYSAPAQITTAQTVTIKATSVADPAKSATALVKLVPFTLSVSPPSANLTASQQQQFTSSVGGSANIAVTWSLSSTAGTISATGLYSAPAQIRAAQIVTVRATSVADLTKSTTAVVRLVPVIVTISVSPLSASVTASQQQQFSSLVSSSSNTAVTWSLSSATGTVTSAGLYSAPAQISTAQAVTLKATSVADPTKSAIAIVKLIPPPRTLRQEATKRQFLVGSAADPDESILDPLYPTTLGAQYNFIEPENAMKWTTVHPAQTLFDFAPADQLVALAQAYGMAVRGHNLVWGTFNPTWLTTLANGALPATMATVLQDHISQVATHYKGQVYAWDVVNEAVSDQASGIGTDLAPSIWLNQPGIGLTGTGYIEQAFRWAHQADPAALLFYNDYNIEEAGPKFDAVYNMAHDFVIRGVPISGIGFEMHISTTGYPSQMGLSQNIQRLASLGLQVHITEMDVRIPVDQRGNPSAADLDAQAQTYQRILTICLQNPACTAFQTWGFTDKHSWIPGSVPGFGAALPFDASYQTKPAFNALIRAFQLSNRQ